jgi:hypothetical protein
MRFLSEEIMFIENESFKHKIAKELLFSWLNNIEKRNEDFCELIPFKWRVNYGIYKELKFHETDHPYYFELSEGLYDYDKNPEKRIPKNYLDWFDPNYDRGKILFVPDITIFHKGTACILIEIVHSNLLSENKINAISKFFDGYHVEVFEIEAEEILKKTCVPKELKIINKYIN